MINSSVSPSSHLPSAHPSVPQIRSRITVVCAECKRLKLKCDRRTPCGSCTKRDTVSRCVYSPAAAEKVDLHSLNNRLIQVEATLSLITSGQTPPAFQSSYPHSQVQPNSATDRPLNRSLSQLPTAPQHHQHHHHISVPSTSSSASISLSAQDLSSIWLDELDSTDLPLLNVILPYPWASDVDPVKLEAPSGTELSGPCPGTTNEDSSRNPFQSQGGQPNSAHLSLPPLSAYYTSGSPVSLSEAQLMPQSYPLTSHISAQPHDSDLAGTANKPSVTPSLVALLPPLTRTRQLLRNAANVIRERPVPLPACLLSSLSDVAADTGTALSGRNDAKVNRKGKGKACLPSLTTHWDILEVRAMCLIGSRGLGYRASPKTTDRKEKERVGVRAREIFFGGGASSTPPIGDLLPNQRPGAQAPTRGTMDDQDPSERTGKERGESLPFFAIICMLLALGAAASKTPAREDVAVQLPIRDERDSPEFFYALAQQSLNVWENNTGTLTTPSADDKESSKANEDEKLDYLIACLLVVRYQLFEPHPKPKGKASENRRINALNKVFSLVGKMVNMARAMGLGKDRKLSVRCKDEGVSMARSNVKEPLAGKDGKKRWKIGDKRKRKDDLRRLIWWDIVFYELFISDALGHSSLLASSPSAVKLPRPASPLPSDESDSEQEEGPQDWISVRGEEFGFHDVFERYHGARCRLAKIAQMVKQKLAQPDCCCGYTLDQAATLEAEVNSFLEGLPLPLRFSLSNEAEDAYTTQTSNLPHPNKGNDPRAKLRLQSCELAIIAQRLIIIAYLPFVSQSSTLMSSSPTSSKSTSTDGEAQKGSDVWIPALQPVVNAAQCIIRASKALLQVDSSDRPLDYRITPSLLDLYPVEKALLDAVIICTHAGTFHGTLFSFHQAADNAFLGLEMLRGLNLDPESHVLLGRVKKRFHVIMHPAPALSVHGIKRKHDLIGIEGAGYKAEVSECEEVYTSHLNAGTDQSLQYAARSDVPVDSMVSRAPSIESTGSGRDPETGQKEKKHAKKSHPYPPVGIRIRQRKEPVPPFLRLRVDSPSTSIPSPGGESGIRTPRQDNETQSSLAATPTSDAIQHQLTPSSEYGPPQQQCSQVDVNPPVMASLLDGPSYRRSSNSLSQDLHLHSQHEARQGYTTNLSDAYEQGQKVSPHGVQMDLTPRVDSFEGNGGDATMFSHIPQPSGAVRSSSYGTSGRLSSSDASPYLTNSGMAPSMAPFSQASQSLVPHQAPPPTYGQELTPNGDSHQYYHLSPETSFNGAFDRPEEPSYIEIGLDTPDGAPAAIVRNRTDSRIAGTRGRTPNTRYEKGRPAIYDTKPPLDEFMQTQMHHHVLQHQPFDVGQHHLHPQNQHPMTMESPTQGWAHQGAIAENFWAAPVGEYKYIH